MPTPYGSVSGFTDYHEARGRVIPGTWDNDSMTAALLVASEWLDHNYGSSFSGEKTGGYTQEREWPRTGAYTSDIPSHVFEDDDIPERVVNATYEAAFREATKPGALNVDFTPNKYKSVSVDGAISVSYSSLSYSSDVQLQMITVDKLLAPLLTGPGAGFSGLSGSVTRV